MQFVFGRNEATLQYVVFRGVFICRVIRGNAYTISKFVVLLRVSLRPI